MEPILSSPLEQFVRDYVEAREGAWEEIEPQVYDLLIGSEMVEIAFDPEALPEHPQAQLASLGSPLIDRLLGDAATRWSAARLYRIGLNLHPHDIETRARRAISLPADASLKVERVRAMSFPQAIFWFKTIFSSDQKEEEILPVGMDLHYLREVRHLDALTASDRLCPEPEVRLAECRHPGMTAGYRAARGHVVRTVTALANSRRREWAGRVEKQIARMSDYYEQLRKEAEEQSTRGTSDAAAIAARTASRRDAINREERLRIAELRQKSAVRVTMKLASIMVVQQPKLMVSSLIMSKDRIIGPLELVWDPLSESIEAVPCPSCGQPQFGFGIERGRIVCAACPKTTMRR